MGSGVAMLVYERHEKARRKASHYDALENIGAHVVRDALERAGIDVAYCSPESAHKYRVVLVSLHSMHDNYNFIRAVAGKPYWKPRRRSFRVIVGGAGLVNIYPIRHFVDYAGFGRGEAYIVGLVRAILDGREEGYTHPSVMRADNITDVEIAQADPYSHTVKIGRGLEWQEGVLGCPLRCGFCMYTYTRKWAGGRPDNYVRGGIYGKSREVTLKNYLENVGGEREDVHIVFGIDGLSERLRFAFGKRIKNEDIIAAAVRASETAEERGKAMYIKAYMIGSYPSETREDFDEFIDTMRRAAEAVKGGRVMFVVHLTPFNAMPVTPGAWLPVSLAPEWRSMIGGQTIVKTDKFHAIWSRSIGSQFTHLREMVIIRATPESDELVLTLALNSKLRTVSAGRALATVTRAFDVDPYLREYSLDERLSTWYMHTYMRDDVLKRAARRLKITLGLEGKDNAN